MPKTIYTRSFCAASNTIFMTCGGDGCMHSTLKASIPALPSALWQRFCAVPVFDFTAVVTASALLQARHSLICARWPDEFGGHR
ncbi:hypothetical protein DTO96_102513 [Ephemeroptericola cinctiostellae]|uniref:Uncharacterized protein n=1 Tax=Ephemeroptericola cinctiostellae TaxID=2268024 RepID=A0A345DEG9_9BURK|nr:hypothetical protein [Ephemeroptericola cinctiostellae]AXF86757.1 hypothetical protein DTO96_102513 [Ephemeroptericola cinctiostellae]